jgi:hypothetical protein
MLDTLAKICDDCGRLRGVSCTRFGGDANFVTAVGLEFERLSVILRANPDDDSLDISLGTLTADAEETLSDISHSAPWSSCLSAGARWLWQLTNQQGRNDAVRFEFGNPDEQSRGVIELLVVASAVETYAVSRVRG